MATARFSHSIDVLRESHAPFKRVGSRKEPVLI
jgi:hypothetical protein